MKKRLILLHWLNLALTGATLAMAIGSLIPTQFVPGISVLVLLLPLLVIPHLVALLFWIRLNPRKSSTNLIGLAIIAFPLMAQWPYARAEEISEDEVKIATYNVRAFYQTSGAAKKIGNWSQQQSIDILCMQEIRRSAAAPLAKHYPYRTYAPRNKNFSVAIYSKYPIINHSPLEYASLSTKGYARTSAQYADIVLPFDTVRVFNVHLSSTGLQDQDMDAVHSRDELLETGQFVLSKLAATDKNRGLQANHIVKWVKESPHPVILSGDFNGVPGGNLYWRLLQQLHDPYILSGYGTMGSFEPLARRGLFFKIDWTMHSTDLYSKGQYIENITLSDHRPLVTRFSPEPPASQAD
ncbi:endonuclease/exonuclease/phosphatase family protein [Schleiferiaceae bacterium]|nr:endonuclease/exonuclease/phosphatase family protein [Schleiferiaceae bacterium]MDC3217719.1 endonuclease/exonuclease/phosphatase family protein [Schleiferiaceae bacterium]